ncbi:MAG: beta-ketoacyl synthase N-terminal-like domain-containing protein [Pseudomonadota bacterium]
MSMRDDIAIIGMAGLYPKAPDVDMFWSNILNKVDAITDSPDGWLGNGDILDLDSQSIDRIYTRRGGFLGDLARFDARAFGTMPLAIEGAQPDQFLALKLAHDALVDAGLTPGQFDGERTGVILGLAIHANRANANGMQQFWFQPQLRDVLRAALPEVDPKRIEGALDVLLGQLPRLSSDAIPGLVPNILTGRIANRLDLMGPNYIIDAACASSLVTMDLAINELRSGNADVMLAGGVNTTTSPLVYGVFSAIGALSRKGLIRPFGREASGTVLGEGAGIVVLKRLADALHDGDRIHAVVVGSGQSSDGTSTGLMAPRREGAELAVRRAYERSGIDPVTIGLVEAHGTGIPLGEKVEIEALRGVFGDRTSIVPTVPIGSVKSMIGHCIPAAGSASVIKCIMALKNQVVPPTLTGEVNPDCGLMGTPFYAAEAPRPWVQSRDHPRRAAINAFGFGGINAHMILEESPVGRASDPTASFVRPTRVGAPSDHVFAFSGADAAAVRTALDGYGVPAADAFPEAAREAWSAAQDAGPARLAIVAATPEELTKKIAAARKALGGEAVGPVQTRNGVYFEPEAVGGKVAFLFPGEMAQYRDMLREAALQLPAIGDWFSDIAAFSEDRRPVRLQDVIYPPENMIDEEASTALEALMHQVDYGSEMVFAADQAICETLRTMGIVPDGMLGHSTGENAALVASRRTGLDRAMVFRLISEMNRVFEAVSRDGTVPTGVLLTVAALDRAALQRILAAHEGIHFTMDNCPNQAVLFGQAAEIDKLQAAAVEDGAVCTRLPISWGYHTEYVRPLAEGFRELFKAAGMSFVPGEIELYSCASAAPFPDDPVAALDLAIEQYVSRVRFTDSIEAMYANGYRVFIECGPSSNLTAFVRDILGPRPHLAESADNRRRGLLSQLRHVAARLFVVGRKVDLHALTHPAEDDDTARRRAERAAHAKAPALESALPAVSLRGDKATAFRKALGLASGPSEAPGAAPEGPATETGHTRPPIAAGQPPVAPDPAGEVPAPAAQAPAPAEQAPASAAPAMEAHMGLMRNFLSMQERVAHQALAPSAAPRRVDTLDLSGWFDLPFAFRAYLMGGQPDLDRVAPYLSAAERDESQRLGKSALRQMEWSLSRLAVKRAAADVIAGAGASVPEAPHMEVRKDANGAPFLSLPGIEAPAPAISIAHAEAFGVGAAAAPGIRFGIDYERDGRVRDPETFLEAILDPAEAQRIGNLPRDGGTAVAMWSLKEAAAKAIGAGLQGQPKAFGIVDYSSVDGVALLTHGNHRIAAQVRRAGPAVCSVAYVVA